MKAKSAKTRLSAKRRLQSLPRISRPPKRLEEVLAIVESVPRIDFELPPFSELEKGMSITKALNWPDRPFEKPEEISDIALWILMRGVGDPLRSYQAALWYKNLRAIARGARHGSIEAMYWISLRDDHLSFQLDRDPLIEGLNACGKKHDLRHLRECAICQRIFWAKRLAKDQLNDPQAKVGCQDRCKNILRVRKSRAAKSLGVVAKKHSRPPNKEILASVERNVQNWRTLYGRPFRHTKDIAELAEAQDISLKECRKVLEYLETKRAQTSVGRSKRP
jgi:hypothetical protein